MVISSEDNAQVSSDLRAEITNESFGFGRMPERRLSPADSKIFLNMLENPPEPNEAFLDAATEYKRRVIRK